MGAVNRNRLVREALAALGVEKLVLAIHDASFPSRTNEDTGRGSPYSRGAEDFFGFVRELGFDGVQLGPQGQTSPGNLSPYDGSIFSKSTLSLPLDALTTDEGGRLFSRGEVDDLLGDPPSADHRAHPARAFAAAGEARARMERASEAGALPATSFASRASWVEHDAAFEAFAVLHGTDDFRLWPRADRTPTPERILEVTAARRPVVDAWVFAQSLLDGEHRRLRERLGPLGIRIYGDMQVGISLRDRWNRDALFLEGLRMGAPPSRTNPEGQPWGYPVLDPRQYSPRWVVGGLGSALGPMSFVRTRVAKMFAEFDGVRIDHPHGLVCPWVYDAAAADPMEAVRSGGRLFETPRRFDRLGKLAPFAIVREDQIDAAELPYEDDWVRALEPDQIDAYATVFDLVVDEARAAARSPNDVLCEVLSTCPRPLACVMTRHGLGRFRVTQKASITDPDDGYRGENAEPHDWTMIGNHDTPPLLAVIERWTSKGTLEARATYLATRLEPDADKREAFARSLREPARLVTAMFAELFVGPARNVLVFWSDLFGERDVYNTPGLVSPDNWTMRVPRSFREVHRARARAGEAFDVPAALALALRARGLAPELARALGRSEA